MFSYAKLFSSISCFNKKQPTEFRVNMCFIKNIIYIFTLLLDKIMYIFFIIKKYNF